MLKRGISTLVTLLFLFNYVFGYEIHNVSNSHNSNSLLADIAIDIKGFLHVIWIEQDGISSHLYYSKSKDDGKNWSIPAKVTKEGWNYQPAIDVDSQGNPHIVYHDQSQGNLIVYHVVSYDGGNTWSYRVDVSRQYEEGWSGSPQLQIDKFDRIHTVWHHSEGDIYTGVYYSISQDGGTTWTFPLKLSEDFAVAEGPEIYVNKDNNPHVIWQDARYDFRPKKILYRYYNGNEWSDELIVHSDDEHKAGACIVVDSNDIIHITWNQAWTEHGVFYRSFNDNVWSNLEIISIEPGGLRHAPKLAVDSNDNLVAVWQENESYWDGEKFSEPFNVYYNFFTGYWHEPQQIEEGPLSYDVEIRIDIDHKNYGHIVWSKGNKFDFSREVYHMKFNPYPYIEISVDIKPNSFPNAINLGSQGNVPVAIFSTADFDATNVDPTTVTLAGASVKLKGKGTSMASFEDVNGDGLEDIMVHVDTTALELTLGDMEAILEGETFDGVSIRGVDTVRIIE